MRSHPALRQWVVLGVGVMAVAAVCEVAGAAEPVRERLGNGLTVIVRENPAAPVAAISLLVTTGVRWERPETSGLSNFVTAVMVKGTATRSGAELAEAIAALGGKISAAGDIDYTEIRASALARFWRELLVLTAEVALTPKLAPDEVERERQLLLSRIQRRRDNAPSRAFDEFYATLYGAHPYGMSALGSRESVSRIDAAAVTAHYRAYFRPQRMVLAVSGQVVAAEVVAEARRLFGAVPRGDAAAEPAIATPTTTPRRVVVEQPAQQAQIVAGALAPAFDAADHAAVRVLAAVLGGGMGGRLFAELRDRRGLAYTATSFYEATREPGALVLYLGTAADSAAAAEQALQAEVTRVRTTVLGDDELARAKGYVLGSYAMDRRTNARQAWYLAFYESAGAGLDYPDRLRQAVEAVTAADIRRAADKYLASLTTVVLLPR